MGIYAITLDDGSEYEVETEESTVEKPQLEQENSYKKSNLLSDSAIAAGVVGGGVLAHRAFYKPARQIKAKQYSLNMLNKEFLGEPLITPEDIPARLAEKSRIAEQEKKLIIMSREADLETAKVDAKTLQKNLSRNISSFDDEILSESIDSLSTTLTKKAPEFFKNTYANYDALLNRAEDALEKTGKNIMSDVFASEVIDGAIANAVEVGVPEEKLGALISIKKQIAGKDVAPQAMSIRKMRGLVNSAKKDIPQEAFFKLTEKWGTFLENNIPEVSEELVKGNADYRKVAQMRKALYKTIDPKSGEFDRSKLNKMLTGYAKSKIETGLKETITLMAKGNGMATPMADVGESFDKLQNVISKRKQIITSGQKAIESSSSRIASNSASIAQLRQETERVKLETMKWIDKANKIISEESNIARRHPHRSGSLGKTILKGAAVGERAAIATIARKALGLAAFAPAILQFTTALVDPVMWIGDQLGVSIPKKGTRERDILEKIAEGEDLTPEEKAFADDPKGTMYEMLGGI